MNLTSSSGDNVWPFWASFSFKTLSSQSDGVSERKVDHIYKRLVRNYPEDFSPVHKTRGQSIFDQSLGFSQRPTPLDFS
jgi:hypothetical protein